MYLLTVDVDPLVHTEYISYIFIYICNGMHKRFLFSKNSKGYILVRGHATIL
jgi:hypothetical protein